MRARSFAAGAALALAMLAPALAHDYSAPGLKIGHPWSRPAAANGTGAGFLTVINTEATPVTLVSITTPRAREVQFHSTVEEGGMFSMVQDKDGLTIAPHGTLILAPGGTHAMLVGLSARNEIGKAFPATLIFRRGGQTQRVNVEFSVQTSPPARTEHAH